MKRRGFLGLLATVPLEPLIAKKAVPETALPLFPDGAVPTPPAYSFVNDTDTGLYHNDAGMLQICVGGQNVGVPFYK